MRQHIKPFDINEYANRKVRYILRQEGGNQELVHTIRDHYFGHREVVTLPEAQEFVRDLEASDLTVGEFMKFNWDEEKAADA